MMRNRLTDAAITRALRSGTERAARDKDAVWRAVASEMRTIDDERMQMDMRRKRNHILALTGAVAAAALFAVFFSLTPEGTALAGRLIQFFEPEKRITTQIEGGTETQNAQLAQNTSDEIGYVMYYDAQRYVKQSKDGIDYYKALNVPKGYPSVQMEISQLRDAGAEETYHSVLANAGKKFDHAEGSGAVDDPVDGWRILAWDETGADALYEETYVVDNKAGGCFLIRLSMFSEAVEGHGARFLSMLKTFQIVRSDSVSTTPTPSKR